MSLESFGLFHLSSITIYVEYGGSVVKILSGKHYWELNGHILIGWHGSFDPPHGM